MLAAGWLAVSVVRRPRWGRERDETAGDCGRVRLASRKWRGTSNQAALPKQEAKPTSVRRDAVTWPPANPAGCKGQSKPRRAPEQEPDPRRCVPRALPSRSPLWLSPYVSNQAYACDVPTRRRVYIGYLAVHGLFPLRCVPNSVMFPKPSSTVVVYIWINTKGRNWW